MGFSDAKFSLSSLLCHEDSSSLSEQVAAVDNDPYSLNPCSVSEQGEDEYVEKLIREEPTCLGSRSPSYPDDASSSLGKEWLKCARLDEIEWILKTRTHFGFHFRTAYVSVIYFDRYLSRKPIANGKFWAVRLLSVACLSLAAKMEERTAPALSAYPAESGFGSSAIQRMELQVLNALEWRMASITPFVYIHYFIKKFVDESNLKDLVPTAVDFMMTVIKDINLMDNRALVIAAAAVLATFDTQLSRTAVELKISLIPSWESIEIEHIFSCYKLMRQIEMAKIKSPKSVISPKLLATHSSSAGDNDNSSIITTVGAKRKLTFNNHDNVGYIKSFKNS
ncbi:cyclin-D5-1-like [Malania oleifera]|uniref:cyclin-D5-1-like n=1 Tax=Malania oleifera TaxID=397392 RepID=UPI0025ADEBDB|nr:cyclin-D5-1-like [Malania oleifera]